MKNKKSHETAPRAISRRDLLRAGTVGVLGGFVLPASTPFMRRAMAASASGTLRYAFASEPPTLDPQDSGSIWTFRSVMAFCDTLTWQDAAGNIGPGLATSWSVAGDGKVWTFTLRGDVKFHDGTSFDAAAVKFNLDRVKEKKAGGFGQIAGYESSEVVDKATIRVRTSSPYAPLLTGLANGFVGMVSPTAVQKSGTQFASSPVGTGPYVLREWVRQDQLTLERNLAYVWAPPALSMGAGPHVKTIIVRFIPEEATRVAALERGEVEVVENVPAQEVDRLKKTGKYRITQTPQTGAPWHINLNVKRPPTDDLRVRQAIIHAIDQKAVVDTLFFGIGKPAFGPLTHGTFGYDPQVEKLYGYDPTAAARLLDEAGWRRGADGIREKAGQKLRVIFNVIAAGGYDSTATMVQTFLQMVGIQTELRLLERARMFSDSNKGEHNLALRFWLTADPEFLRLHFRSTNIGNWNWSLTSDPKLDALLDEGASTLDLKKRAQVYGELQKKIMQDALMAPLFDAEYVNALSPRVEGLQFDKRTAIVFHDVRLKA